MTLKTETGVMPPMRLRRSLNMRVAGLGLKQLYANISEDNIYSIKLFEKSGFVKVGVKKSWLKTISGWKAEILYQKILS